MNKSRLSGDQGDRGKSRKRMRNRRPPLNSTSGLQTSPSGTTTSAISPSNGSLAAGLLSYSGGLIAGIYSARLIMRLSKWMRSNYQMSQNQSHIWQTALSSERSTDG